MRLRLLSFYIFSLGIILNINAANPTNDTLKLKENKLLNNEIIPSYFPLEAFKKQFPLEKSFSIPSASTFTFENIKKEYGRDKKVDFDIEFANNTFKKIEKENNWVEKITDENVETLPLGVKYDLNGVEYSIGFVKAKITPQHTEFTVFARIKLPQTDEKGNAMEIFFGADNIKLSHGGGIFGDANLMLLGDVFIPFNGGKWLLSLKGGFDYKTGDPKKSTYVTINCDGVKDLELIGDVQFSRSMLLPVDEKGELLKENTIYKKLDEKKDTIKLLIPNRVKGDFKVSATDWNDMIIDVNLTPFVLAKKPKKFMFSVNKATFDFSDIRTENVVFPDFYTKNNLLLPNKESWRGVYVKSLNVGLPKPFKTTKSVADKERVSFRAADMIIDSHGVSGKFSVNNLIPLKTGITSKEKGWAFSVDSLSITLAANTLIGAGFDGRILLPISESTAKKLGKISDEEAKEETANSDVDKKNKNSPKLGLGYRGIITEEEYSLAINLTDTISFSIWKAKATLFPNSAIELKVVDDDKFRPKAVLNGRMSISANKKKKPPTDVKKNESTNPEKEQQASNENDDSKNKKDKTVEFKGIEFQNLVLQTESPSISASYFGYKGEMKLSNFPVSISDIAFKSSEKEASLSFNLMLNLMGSEDKGFAAKARLGIVGNLTEVDHKTKWKFDRVDVSDIDLDANIGPIKLKGSLILMENNPIYGDGFSADIEGTFGDFGPITCKTIFGKKDFKYWYVDGAVHGLKLQLGPFQVSGFAGGAFYKMTRRPDAGPEFSPSGLSYIPNENSELGVKAMIYGAIGDESTIAIGAGFEIEFNKSFGVNRLGFFGEAQIMKAFSFPNPVAKLTDKLGSMVTKQGLNGVMAKASKTLLEKATEEYEPEIVGEGAISAKLAIEFDFVNKSFHSTFDLFVNVGSVITGRASKGRAGWGVSHIDKDKWYVHMGTPTDRLGLILKLGSLKMEAGGYFMTGDDLPGSPPPPPIVAEILGVDVESLNYMRDENSLGGGKGFAFGHDFSIDTGDIKFLMFFARFQAGGGFDIMLKDYGDAQCANTNDEIGFNGWYANGQGYAYLQGELGIKIKLFFVRKKISIIKGGAAVLLQTKAPNPIWMRGFVGGRYNLLGGAVKGSFRFKLELGEECEFLDESPLGGIKLITDITPKEGTNEVDVFAAPQATFSMKINEPIIIPEDKGDKTYKVILEKFAMIDENGKEIEGELEWNYMKDRATFISTDILPPNAKMKVQVEVSFQEKIEGIYKTILDEGKKAVEFEERSFTTGTAPSEIPLHNIKYSYPVVDQKQFYKDEYKTGYVQLKRGQDYLFNDPQWVNKVKVINANGKESLMAMNYNLGANKVSYTLPKINNEDEYLINIISKPKNINGSVADPGTKTDITNLDDDNSFEVTSKNAASVSKDGEIGRLSYSFKTSKHSTFAKKIKSININKNLWGPGISSDVIFLVSTTSEYEGFDIVELKGSTYTENMPLVTTEATLQDDYFQKDINPIIYQKYSPKNRYTVSRDINELGFRPVKALPLLTSYVTSVEENVNLVSTATRFPFRYNLPHAYKVDYVDIRNRVLNDYVDGLINYGDTTLDILDNDYLFMRQGKYAIKMSYNLPGGIKGTSVEYDYKNPIKIR